MRRSIVARTVPVCLLALSCKNSVVTSGGSGKGGAGHASGVATGTSMGVPSEGAAPNMTTGDVPPTTGTGPSPTDPMLNQKFCGAVGNCFPNCQAVFNSYLYPPCAALGANLVSCLVGNFDQMSCQAIGQVCFTIQEDFIACRRKTPSNCGVDVGGHYSVQACSDTRECPGGEETATCNINGDMASCICYLNAQPIATCAIQTHAFPAMDFCSLDIGCCGPQLSNAKVPGT